MTDLVKIDNSALLAAEQPWEAARQAWLAMPVCEDCTRETMKNYVEAR